VYARRYELCYRRLMLERHYDCSSFLMSEAVAGIEGEYSEPAADLGFQKLANSLAGHVAACSGRIKQL